MVTEFTARWLPAAGPHKLVQGWDFSGPEDSWQAEDGAKVVSDSGMRHLFGTAQPLGMKTTVKQPAGLYLVEVVTGVRPGAEYTVQWTTAKEPNFDAARSAKSTKWTLMRRSAKKRRAARVVGDFLEPKIWMFMAPGRLDAWTPGGF